MADPASSAASPIMGTASGLGLLVVLVRLGPQLSLEGCDSGLVTGGHLLQL